MKEKYSIVISERQAVPRSKRMREAGQSPSSAAVLVSGTGGGNSSCDGHTHTNLPTLERIGFDENDDLYLTARVGSVDDETGELAITHEKVKAGYADQAGVAHDLDMDSPVNERFLRKDQADSTNYLLEALGGINIGEAIDSLTSGAGILLRPDGSIQADSLELRRSLTVIELIFNRLSAQEGEATYSESGVIESIEVLEDGTYRLPLRKRHDKDFTAFDWNDVVFGSVNDLATGGGNYRTSWLRVIGVNPVQNYIEAVLYPDEEVPGGKNYPPEPLMMLTRRGNTSDEDRQSYWYISSYEKCICMLDGVTKPILEENNYSIIIGRMKNLSLFDNLPINYRQSYVYCRGLIRQDDIRIDVTGKPIYEFIDRGVWSPSVALSSEPYYFETKNVTTGRNETSTVYHRGVKWQCLKTGTTLEPKWNSTGWAFLEGNGEFSIDFESSKGFSFFYGRIDTVIEAKFYHGTTDITEDVMSVPGTVITWSRDTGKEAEDRFWSPTFVDDRKNKIHLIESDMGSGWPNTQTGTFKISVIIPLGEENYLRESEELLFNL